MLNCAKRCYKALWSKIRPIGATQGQTWPIWGKRDQSGTKGANLVQIELNGEKQKQNLNALSIIALFLMPYAQSHIPYFLFFSPFIHSPYSMSLIFHPLFLIPIPHPFFLITNLIPYTLSINSYPLSLNPYPISHTHYPYFLFIIPYP